MVVKHKATAKDFMDPFNAGQMVGMLVMLTFIEKNRGITPDAIEKIKWSCANNIEQYMGKAAEDIFLMVDGMIKDIEAL